MEIKTLSTTMIKINPKEETILFEKEFDTQLKNLMDFVGGGLELIHLESDKEGNTFLLMCDKEGASKGSTKYRYVGIEKEFLISGNSLVCKVGKDGDYRTISESEALLIESRIRFGEGL